LPDPAVDAVRDARCARGRGVAAQVESEIKIEAKLKAIYDILVLSV
jgi:hypothetical protein